MSRVEVLNPQPDVLKVVKTFLKKLKSDPELELTELSKFMLHLRGQKTPQNELLKIICDAAIDLSSRQKENKDLSKRIHKSLEKMEKNFNEKGWDEQSGVVHEAISEVIMNYNPLPEVVVTNPVARVPSAKLVGRSVTPQRDFGCCVIS